MRTARAQHQLLSRMARTFGVMFTLASLAMLAITNAGDLARYGVTLALMTLTAVLFAQIGRSSSMFWPGLTYLVSLAAVAALLLPGTTVSDVPTLNAVTSFVSLAIPSLIATVALSRRVALITVAGFLPVLVLSILASLQTGRAAFVALSLVAGWVALFISGIWLAASIRRAFVGMAKLGQAHAAERQASEDQAQRRYGARLLHDTVLATLSLMAHGGWGVTSTALREQAGQDAGLLRQLRLGNPTGVHPAAGTEAGAVAQPALFEDALAAVKGRFASLGLDITWHGASEVRLPDGVLEALVRSISECLENVRRHSGVAAADVTVAENDRTVRAMVTDTGVGFEYAEIGTERLGIAESVVARIRDVGGTVRIFSSQGAGTTVLLEVPR